MGVVTSLAGAQLRHRPGRWALLAVGVALALTLPVIAAGTGTVVSADTLRRTVGTLDPGSRGILVTDNRSIYDRGPTVALDAVITKQLGRISSNPVRKEVVFRQLTSAGSTFFLAGADHLSTAVRLESGRMPRSCTPARCEVVLVGDTDAAAMTKAAAKIGVVVVGQARRTDPLVVGGSFDTGRVPLLLSSDPDELALLNTLQLFSRTYGWVVALDVERVLALGVPAYVHLSTEALNVIAAQGLGIGTDPPDEALATANQRADLSSRRFDLLGGSTAVLLLGFAVVAAIGLRREHVILVAVLRRRGAQWPTITRLTFLEAAFACVLGAIAGAALGAAAVVAIAQHANLPVGRTVGHALTAATGGALLLVGLAISLTVAVLLWPDTERRTAWRSLDLAAIVALGTAVLLTSRGAVATGELSTRSDPLLVALPVLAAVTAGLVAARIWLPAARLAERVIPRRSVAGRIALLGAVRRPLRAVATTAFLTAAIASVVFAGAYRSTLLQGSADQAAYAVPLDATLRSSAGVPNPLALTSPAQLAAIAPGVHAFGVVRSSGVVRTGVGDSVGLPVLGLDPASLEEVRRWSRTTGSDRSPASVAKSLQATGAPATAPALPAGTKVVSLAVSGQLADTDVDLWLSTSDGRETAVSLKRNRAGDTLAGQVPDVGGGPLRVVALTIRETVDYATYHQHAIGEGNTDQPDLAGTFLVSSVTADGKPVTWDWSGWGSGLASATQKPGGLAVAYRISGPLVVVQPAYRASTAADPLPVVVDPETARSATNGVLTLTLGSANVSARVVGVLPRFPTTTGRFVLAGQPALSHVLDGQQPGTGAVGELWASADNSKAANALTLALAGKPYSDATVVERTPIAHQLAGDPVSRGSSLLLALAAVLALLVAAAAVVLLVSGDRRDDAGELHAWESDGVRPATLRRMLLIRALSVVAVAVPVGLAAGLVLAHVGANVVAVDASGSTPEPPLHVQVGPLWSSGLLVLGLGIAVGLAALVAGLALRERLPVPPDVELR